MTADWIALPADIRSRTIAYYPALNPVTGSVPATLLLQQIIFRWAHNGRKPFYKFSAPCEHRYYRPGDSWQEEMGFTRTEFETARRRLGTKVRQGTPKGKLRTKSLILYWTDRDRLTWYELNEPLLLAKVQLLSNADTPQSPGIAENLQYQELPDCDSPPLTKMSPTKTAKKRAAPRLSSTSDEKIDPAGSGVAANHPAIQAWRQVLDRYPRKQCWPFIAERLGKQPDAVLLAQVMAEWLASGYSPENANGILDWYERRKSPGNSPKGAGQPNPNTMALSVGLVPAPPMVGGRF